MSCNSFSFIILVGLLSTNTIAMNKSRSCDSLNNQISNQQTPELRRIAYLENEVQTNNNAVQQLSKQMGCLTELLTKLPSQNNNDSSPLVKKPHFEPLPYESLAQELDEFKQAELKRNCPPQLLKRLNQLSETQTPRSFKKMILLHGPPGSGKSSLGKLIALIGKRPFIFVTPGQLSNEYKSSGLVIINELFGLFANSQRPGVIILDEITGFSDKLHNLWTQLDTCKSNPHLIVVATTNNPSSLHSQLRSRSREYYLGYPNYDSRFRILKNYLLTSQVSEKLLKSLASKSNGFSLHKLEEVVENAKDNNYERLEKSKATAPEQQLLNQEDIKQAFNLVYKQQKAISQRENFIYLKIFLRKWTPIIFPLLRMACDCALYSVLPQNNYETLATILSGRKPS